MSEGFKGLVVHNTLTRRKEEFIPLDPTRVRMYVCGPTVYDYAHIGNARPVIVFDVLFRLLRHLYGEDKVTYVRNITDVDDKINARALRDFGVEIEAGKLTLNEPIRAVTEKTADQFHNDVAAIGTLSPTVEPRATEFVLPREDGRTDMVTLIQNLIDRGHAYTAKGEILFDTASMRDYGELSHRKLDEQQAGARVAVEAHKKQPSDFVLWKESAPEEPGWEAVFQIEGKPLVIRGRPGWHIECSAMSAAYLGEVFDIHGGGLDLIFPHHENEIAQSRCAHGTHTMARYWMHNGFLQVEGRKMSKSEGNFVTINELLETDRFGGRSWPGEVLRLAMLMTHYRQPIDFSVDKLMQAEKMLDRLYRVIGNVEGADISETKDEVAARLKDDLNTWEALIVLQSAADAAEAKKEPALAAALKGAANLLGLLAKTHDEWEAGKRESAGIDEVAIEAQIEQRLTFLKDKNFQEADRIRAELTGKGVQLMDYKDSETGERRTRWEVKR